MNFIWSAVKGEYAEAYAKHRENMATAARGAIKTLAVQVQKEARAEIARGGLSARWQRGFRTYIFPRQSDGTMNITLRGFHRIGYANIFERGGTIRGKPLLWLPLPAAPKKINGKPTTPRNFSEIAPLRSANRPGRPPMLVAYLNKIPTSGKSATVAQLRSGARNARRQQVRAAFGRRGRAVQSVPMFIGIPIAQIRDRLNVSAVYERAEAQLPQLFVDLLAAAEKEN